MFLEEHGAGTLILLSLNPFLCENEASHGSLRGGRRSIYVKPLYGADKQELVIFHCRLVNLRRNNQEPPTACPKPVCMHTHTQTFLTEMQMFPTKIQQGLTGPASWSYKGWQVLSMGWRKVLFPQLHSQGNALQAWHWEPVWLGSEACQHIQEVKSERGRISNRASCTQMPRQWHALSRQGAYQPGLPWVLSKKPLRMALGQKRKKQSLEPREELWLP